MENQVVEEAELNGTTMALDILREKIRYYVDERASLIKMLTEIRDEADNLLKQIQGK